MNTPDRIERLRRALADAANQLKQATGLREHGPDPAPGDLYVFGLTVAAAVEWLVVRSHPDDPNSILLVPADDFPLVGPADVEVPFERYGRPFVVRCGEGLWVPLASCPARLRVGTVPDEITARVRRTLAAHARGTLAAEGEVANAEDDPEYASWLGQIGRARVALEERTGALLEAGGTILSFERFTSATPKEFAREPEVALAAACGGLLQALGEALASGEPRYLSMPLGDGSDRILAADSAGVSVAWKGSTGTAPPPLSAAGPSGRVEAEWRAGAAADCHHAVQTFSWFGGQVHFLVGSVSPIAFTVRL